MTPGPIVFLLRLDIQFFFIIFIAAAYYYLSINVLNPVLGKWGFGFCNWGLTFGLGLEDSLFNSSTRGTFSCLIFEQNTFLEIG